MSECDNCYFLSNEIKIKEEDLQILLNCYERSKKENQKLFLDYQLLENKYLDEINVLKNEIDNQNSRIDKMKSLIEEKTAYCNEINEDLNIFKEKNFDLQAEVDKLICMSKNDKRSFKLELKLLKDEKDIEIKENANLKKQIHSLENQKIIQKQKDDANKNRIEKLEQIVDLNDQEFYEFKIKSNEKLVDLQDVIDSRVSLSSKNQENHSKCKEKLESVKRISSKWRTLSLKRKEEILNLKQKSNLLSNKKVKKQLRLALKKLTSARRQIKQMNEIYLDYKIEVKKKLHDLPKEEEVKTKNNLNKFKRIRESLQNGLK